MFSEQFTVLSNANVYPLAKMVLDSVSGLKVGMTSADRPYMIKAKKISKKGRDSV